MYTGFATQFWSYGASDFEDGRCAIASEAAMQATTDFLSTLHAAGPEDWPNQRWYELALDFAQGRYALMVDSDHYVAYFEDARHSEPRRRDRVLAATERAGRTASEPLDVVGRRERAYTQSRRRLAIRRVGDGRRLPAQIGVRGEHEPDAPEHVGRRRVPHARAGLGIVLRRRAEARRARSVGARDTGAELPSGRHAMGRGTTRGVCARWRSARGARAGGGRDRQSDGCRAGA